MEFLQEGSCSIADSTKGLYAKGEEFGAESLSKVRIFDLLRCLGTVGSMERLRGCAGFGGGVWNNDVKKDRLAWKDYLCIWCYLLTIDWTRFDSNWGASLAEEISHQPDDRVVAVAESRGAQLLAGQEVIIINTCDRSAAFAKERKLGQRGKAGSDARSDAVVTVREGELPT